MTDMSHMTVRVRRKDQNAFLGFATDHWHPYSFPTIDAAVSFGIRSAHTGGWEVMFEDGTTLRRNEEVHVAGKSLYAKPKPQQKSKSLYTKPARPSLIPHLHDVPEGTVWRNGHLVTVMADGLECAWDICGACSQGVMACICGSGVSAPNSIRYIAMKTAGIVGGQKWENVDTSRKRSYDGPTTYVKTWQSPTVTAAPAKTAGKSLRPAAPPARGTKSLRKSTDDDRSLAGWAGVIERSRRQVHGEDDAPVIEAKDIDLAKVDSDAANMATALEAQLTQRLGGTKSLHTTVGMSKKNPQEDAPAVSAKSLPSKPTRKPLALPTHKRGTKPLPRKGQ